MLLDLVDVFGSRPLSGNPLAVVRGAEAMDAAQMLKLTQWLGFSETAFLLPATDPDADYRVRIFYPAGELPFAGHPTLGTCHAWLQAGGVSRQTGRIVQECGVGLVEVKQDGERLSFAAPPLTRSGPRSGRTRRGDPHCWRVRGRGHRRRPRGQWPEMAIAKTAFGGRRVGCTASFARACRD